MASTASRLSRASESIRPAVPAAGNGRCVLFQKARLAAFLQAGLLVPAQDESLTVRATRNALAKLDVDPGRLLN